MFFAALCALVFRVNLPLSMLVTLYTNPLTLVPIYFVAFQLGRLITGEGNGFTAAPEMNGDLTGWFSALLDWIASLGKPLAVGLPSLAVILAILGYFAVKAIWRLYLIRAWHQRRARNLKP